MSTPTAPPKSTAVAVSAQDWEKPGGKAQLEKLAPMVRGHLERALPKFLAGSADRFLRCMITSCQMNPSLLNCTPISLFAATMQAAQLGFEVGGPLGLAYLIPYSKNATLQVGYKGFIQLGYRSSMLASLSPVTVRQGDLYRVIQGSERRIIHEPIRNNKSPVSDYYVIVKLTNGGTDFEEFTRDEAIIFRDRFAATRARPSGPWYEKWDGEHSPQQFDEMALKTLVRKLFKRLPVSPEAQRAASLDEAADMGVAQNLAVELLPEFVPADQTATERLEEKLDQREKPQGSSPPPAAPGQSDIAKLLDQLEAKSGDANGAMGWIKDQGYDSLADIEMLSPKKQAALAETLRKKVAELDG